MKVVLLVSTDYLEENSDRFKGGNSAMCEALEEREKIFEGIISLYNRIKADYDTYCVLDTHCWIKKPCHSVNIDWEVHHQHIKNGDVFITFIDDEDGHLSLSRGTNLVDIGISISKETKLLLLFEGSDLDHETYFRYLPKVNTENIIAMYNTDLSDGNQVNEIMSILNRIRDSQNSTNNPTLKLVKT